MLAVICILVYLLHKPLPFFCGDKIGLANHRRARLLDFVYDVAASKSAIGLNRRYNALPIACLVEIAPRVPL
jgi:hypothetical protein